MSTAVFSQSDQDSALLGLELRGKLRSQIPGSDVTLAIFSDIGAGLPLSRAALLKYVTGNSALASADLQAIIESLKHELVTLIDKKPEVALSYMHAAIICATELNGRG